MQAIANKIRIYYFIYYPFPGITGTFCQWITVWTAGSHHDLTIS